MDNKKVVLDLPFDVWLVITIRAINEHTSKKKILSELIKEHLHPTEEEQTYIKTAHENEKLRVVS